MTVITEEVSMHGAPKAPDHPVPQSDADVRAFLTKITGLRQPAGAAARRYERAAAAIAEEVTAVPASLTHQP